MSIMYQLTNEGKKYLEEKLPERRLIEEIGKKEITIKAVKNLPDSNIAINWAKKNNWIKISEGLVRLTEEGKKALICKTDLEMGLIDIKISEETGKKNVIQTLLSRKLIELVRDDIIKKAHNQLEKGESRLTPELIKTGLWKKAKLKSYNVKSIGKKIYPGRIHPLMQVALKVKDVFLEMGFKEMKGPFVESSYNNFDLLFMPQDHPGREIMDTFFMKNPSKTKSLPKDYKIVKAIHENGGKTGSKGWDYEWKESIAKTNILRTHTTASTFTKISKGLEIPCKYFSVDRVFRNETIDKTHLPEFFQIEGFVADPSLNLRNMMGIFKEFYSRFGIKKLRFKPAYNPYTEPSMEIFGWHDKLNKWIEIGNSGMFRPETLLPWGVKCPVIAWGLSVERLAMLFYEIDDIRQILGPTVDIDFIRKYPNMVE